MQSFFTFVFVFISIPFTFGQQTYLPDSNFEQALIFEGLDTVLDDSITTSAIDTLTFLNLEPFGIVDLTGIEDFIALKSFVCRNNDIQQLDLSSNLFIEFVNCENNNITSVNVTNCGSLKHFFAEDNNLTSIDFTQNPLLETLEMNQNGVSTIDLSSNLALKTLRLSSNALTSIDLTNNTSLEYLELSGNQLTALNVTNAPNLKVLVAHINSIQALDLTTNSNLEILLVMVNEITSLDLQNCSVLTSIDCFDNNLESLILPPVDILSTANHSLGTASNPNLYCIECDNPAYANSNWTIVIDSFTVLSQACNVGIDELETTIEIFPNPTKNGWISVKSETSGHYCLIGLDGALLQKGEIKKGTTVLDFLAYGYGMYVLQLNLENQLITKRIELL